MSGQLMLPRMDIFWVQSHCGGSFSVSSGSRPARKRERLPAAPVSRLCSLGDLCQLGVSVYRMRERREDDSGAEIQLLPRAVSGDPRRARAAQAGRRACCE